LPHSNSPPRAIARTDYRPPAFRVPEVTLAFDLDETHTRVTAELLVLRNGLHDEPLFLDGVGLTLLSVAVDSRPLNCEEYVQTGSSLIVRGIGERAIVTTIVEISPRTNTDLLGLYSSNGILCSQCEAEGFRRITFFPDRPDILSRYSVTLRASRAHYPVLLTNGNPRNAGNLAEGRHFAEWVDPFPKPCYLFAVVAGHLGSVRDEFKTRSGRSIRLAIWARSPDLERCAHAMSALKAAMSWEEQVYGLEYDLEVFNIVAVGDFNFGAMENKGLNIFNSKYVLADPASATDTDLDAVSAYIAHEYFHNWTGNRVTCRSWFELALKEGLTVYRDHEFTAHILGHDVQRLQEVRQLRGLQFAEDSGPLAHAVRPDSYLEVSNLYTPTVYRKGAELVRMLATLVGNSAFREGLALYLRRYDGCAVTVDDFLQVMQEVCQEDLAQFARWYCVAGTPQVSAILKYDSTGSRAVLTLSQSIPATPGQSDKPPLHIPIRAALIARSSGRRLGEEVLLELREATQSYVFEKVTEPPLASLLRGFTAPVTLKYALDCDELALLALHDDDPFQRCDAMERLALAVILPALREPFMAHPGPLVRTIEALLLSRTPSGILAYALELPAESRVGQELSCIDPQLVHRSVQCVRCTIGTDLAQLLWSVYDANFTLGADRTRSGNSRRRLRNVALGYLAATGSSESLRAAQRQLERADNMTDRIAALEVFANSQSDTRAAPLAAFYARHRENPTLIDKWFAVQAQSSRADTLQEVRKLAMHGDFSLANPNRCRALIGTFTQNQARFHDASGAAYEFVADRILEIDRINPTVAADLAGALSSWTRFASAYASRMRTQLQRLLSEERLSTNLHEVVEKSLQIAEP
jgi:aminopeptidase N